MKRNKDTNIAKSKIKDTFRGGLTDILYIGLVFLVTFCVYFYTLSPTIIFGDSPEIIASSYMLGVAHPTGFPLYMLLSNLFASIFSFGEYAFRTNLFSALISSLNAVLIYFLVRKIFKRNYLAFITALVFSFGRTVWLHATYSQVYSLAAFWGLLSLFCAISYTQSQQIPRKNIYIRLFYLCSSFGLAVHLTSVFFVFGSIVFLFLKEKNYDNLRVSAIRNLPYFFAPFLLYLYLPLRASTGPPINWDNPSSLENFIYYITQRQWNYMMFNRNLYQLQIFAQKLISFFTSEYSILIFLAVLGGGYILIRKNTKLFISLLAILFSNILFFSIYGDQSNLEVLFRYFLPVYSIFIIFLAAFLDFVITTADKVKYRNISPVLFLIFLFIPLLLIFYNFRHSSNRGNTFALDHARNLLASADKNGTLILQVEDDVFPVLYAKYVLKERSDITVYDRSGNLFGEFYKPDRSIDALKYFSGLDYDRFKFSRDIAVISNSQDEVLIADTSNPNLFYRQKGILYLTQTSVFEGDSKDLVDIFSQYKLPPLDSINQSYKNREQYARYLLFKAKQFIEADEKDQALALMQTVENFASDVWFAMEFLSYLYNALGDNDKAIAILEKATGINSHLAAPFYDLGLMYAKSKKIPQAKRAFEKALIAEKNFMKAKEALDKLIFFQPESPLIAAIEKFEKEATSSDRTVKEKALAYTNLGIAYGQKGETETAVLKFQKAIELDDSSAIAYFNLGNAYMNLIPPLYPQARQEFEKAILLDSTNATAYLNLGSLCAYKMLDYICAIDSWTTFLDKDVNFEGRKDIEREIERMKSLTGYEATRSAVEEVLFEETAPDSDLKSVIDFFED